MGQLRTAEDVLRDYINNDPTTIMVICRAMKEYAEQFIDEAAERATTTEDPWGLGVDIDVDKESILELKLDLK